MKQRRVQEKNQWWLGRQLRAKYWKQLEIGKYWMRNKTFGILFAQVDFDSKKMQVCRRRRTNWNYIININKIHNKFSHFPTFFAVDVELLPHLREASIGASLYSDAMVQALEFCRLDVFQLQCLQLGARRMAEKWRMKTSPMISFHSS